MVSVSETGTLLRVQTWDIRAPIPQRAEEVAGASWPRATGTCIRGRIEVMCVGPADWLVLAAAVERLALLDALNEAFRASPFRATDVSHALSRIQIAGPMLTSVLAKSCSLNLTPEAFAIGATARTRFANVPVVLRRLQPAVFESIVSVSFRDYLLGWLKDSVMESTGVL